MIYLLLKCINPATNIEDSNLKYEIEKSTLAKFDNNVKYLLYDMSSNYNIIIDKGGHQKDCVHHVFRDGLSGPTLN